MELCINHKNIIAIPLMQFLEWNIFAFFIIICSSLYSESNNKRKTYKLESRWNQMYQLLFGTEGMLEKNYI